MTSSPRATVANQPDKTRVLSSLKLSLSLKKRNILLALALAAGVFAVYSPVLHNSFLNYDDNVYITINPL